MQTKIQFLAGTILLSIFTLHGQGDPDRILRLLDARSAAFGEIAREIWSLAEIRYQEEQSAALLQCILAKAGSGTLAKIKSEFQGIDP